MIAREIVENLTAALAELELIEWLPAGFDPDEFDPEATDHAVRAVSRTS